MNQRKIAILSVCLSLAFLLLVSTSMLNVNNKMMVFASSSDENKCQDSAKKISDNADGHVSGNVCEIGLSRDSPNIKLSAKPGESQQKANELTGMEFKYQPTSASSNDKVLILAELQLKQSEVNDVQKSLLDKGWQVTALHNHELFESPFMMYLHAQKSDNLNDALKDIKNTLDRTDCGCV
jgi:hypothetical protein